MNSNQTKHVLITGCSSGIGYCLARDLPKQGYKVLATVRNPDDLTKLQELNVQTHLLDLAQTSSIQKAVDWALRVSNKQIYGLVNNGAYGLPGAVEDLSREALLAQFQTNVFGTQELTNKLLPAMRQNNVGRIIQISSILGLICLPYRGAYNASKYALEALSDTMRLELASTNIKVSLIEPGPIATNFRQNALKMFFQFIDINTSAHNQHYEQVKKRLDTVDNVPFTLPPEAVLKTVIHALNSNKPKIRYKVTVPAKGFSIIKRIFPDRLFDALIASKLG